MTKPLTRTRLDAKQLAGLPTDEVLQRVVTAINERSDDTSQQLGRRLTVGANMLAVVKKLRVRIPATPWREIGSTGQPAFESSWVNFDTTHSSAAFRMDPDGVVHLKGLVKSGVVGNAVCTLPAGFRPPKKVSIATISNSAIGRLSVTNAGAVLAETGSNVWFSLDNAAFVASAPAAPDAFSGNGWPLTLETGLGVPVQGVTAWAAADETDSMAKGYGSFGVSWTPGTGDAVSIRRINGLTPERTYSVTLVFWGG